MRNSFRWLAVVVMLFVVVPLAGAKTLNSHSAKTFAAIPGGTVSLDVSFHDVKVAVVPGDQVKIEVDIEVTGSASKAQDILDDYEPKFAERGKTISMRSARKSGFSFNFFGSVKKKGLVAVTMPPGMNLSLDSASGDCEVEGDLGAAKILVDTASGDVRVDGAADTIVVDVASGDVELELTRLARSVNVDSASGGVRLRGGAEEFLADTASGDVSAYGLTGTMRADTASGDVKAQWDTIPEGTKVLADTASGDVRLVLPSGTAVAGRLSTSSGSLDTDFPGQSYDKGRAFKFQSSAGAVTVDVDTASGDIEVLSN